MSRGPKADPHRAFTRRLFTEWSDRTFATYWRGSRLLSDLVELGAISDAERRAVHAAAIRPNGSVNVCKFARNSEAMLMRTMAERPELFKESA